MRNIIKQYIQTLFGTLVMALALNLFLVPADIAPGGVSGVAIMVNHLSGIPIGVMMLLLNVPIFVLGARSFSRGYVGVSFFGLMSLSLLTDTLSFLKPLTQDMFLSSIYGGLIIGCGIGIVFRSGSSTGGADIVAHLLKKRFPHLSVGRFVLMLDAAVVVLAGLVYRRWEVMLYSAVAIYICSFIVDVIVEGGDFAKVAYIISDKPQAIAEEISQKLEHGSTALKGASMYTGKDKTVLMCVVKKYEIGRLKRIIKEIDGNAFVIVSDAREVLGKGFKKYD